MDIKTYTVRAGDTLTQIAKKFNVSVSDLVKWNDIENPDVIGIGQVLYVENPGEKTDEETDYYLRVSDIRLTSEDLSGNTVFVTWKCNHPEVYRYYIEWTYLNIHDEIVPAGNETILVKNEDTGNYNLKYSELSSIDKEKMVCIYCSVTAQWKDNSKDDKYWLVSFGNGNPNPVQKEYNFGDIPDIPPAPTVTIEKYKITARLENVDKLNFNVITFYLIKNDDDSTEDGKLGYYKKQEWGNLKSVATVTFTDVEADATYKVCCVASKAGLTSSRSDYSSTVSSAPKVPVITGIECFSDKVIILKWKATNSAKKYIIEYILKDEETYGTKENHFDNANIQGKDTVDVTLKESEVKDGIVSKPITIANGGEYYIRLAATNDNTEPPYDFSEIESFSIGTTPDRPTTWSSTTTAIVGDSLNLNWIQNSEDNSKMNESKLRLYINGSLFLPNKDLTDVSYKIGKEAYSDEVVSFPELKEDDTVRICHINTNYFKDGTKIEWDVCTAGFAKDASGNYKYGEYSIKRIVNIYAPPSFSYFNLIGPDGNGLELFEGMASTHKLKAYPLKISVKASDMNNQKPIGYILNIIAKNSYETVDNLGNSKMVISGSSLYSKYFDISDHILDVTLSAGDVNLEIKEEYEIVCTILMDSGLSTTDSRNIKVDWDSKIKTPYATVDINRDDLSANIYPYSDGTGEVLLSVYRRESDGSFTEIVTDVEEDTGIVDPHPTLDYARYRIVAKSKITGEINYNDLPSIPVQEKSLVIQWDETWQNFHVTENGNMLVDKPWNGSMLKLPYNIQVTNSTDIDVSLVEYIGRKRPVSYYGTQIRESASWSTEIPKTDRETLFALRRLSVWMGDVYVREPSGTGYWAQVSVSFGEAYLNLTIPISFDITRVEGGI